MDIKELRRKLQAETTHSDNGNVTWQDGEVGEFILGLNDKGLLNNASRNHYLSEKSLLLSDEELMFRWAVFKM